MVMDLKFQYNRMKKNRFLLISTIVTGLIFLASSCTQGVTDSVSVAVLTATASDEVKVALISDDIDNELDAYVSDSILVHYKDSTITHSVTFTTGGPAVTIDRPDTLYPKTFTLDYGTIGITVANGNVLKGKITAVVNDKMKLKNSLRIVTFTDFFENGNAIAGSKTLTYKGLNTKSLPYWNVSNDLTQTTPGGVITWKSDRLRIKSGNNATKQIYTDDIYSITGSTTGVDSKGTAYSLIIRNNYPLVIGGNWPIYVKGITSLNIKNGTMVLDYGTGNKDSLATVLVNGETSTYKFQ